VNTIMAGAKGTIRAKKYTYAGYTGEKAENDLYIAKDPAGSAQDNLRDLNKKGYRTERPWNETPQPLFEMQPAYEPVAAEPKKAPKQKKKTFLEWVIGHAKKDKQGAMICAGLCCAMLMMVVIWGGEMVQGVQIADRIAQYETMTTSIQTENESLTRELEMAQSGERIRNLAQNQLGMLRPERAKHEVIYIRTADNAANEAQAQTGEPRLEFLDLMLGLLDVFHIGE